MIRLEFGDIKIVETTFEIKLDDDFIAEFFDSYRLGFVKNIGEYTRLVLVYLFTGNHQFSDEYLLSIKRNISKRWLALASKYALRRNHTIKTAKPLKDTTQVLSKRLGVSMVDIIRIASRIFNSYVVADMLQNTTISQRFKPLTSFIEQTV